MNDLPPAPERGTGRAAETGGAMRTEPPAGRTSSRQASPATHQALAARQMENLSANAELLASGLVANTTEHGNGKPIRLVLSRHAEPDGRPGITCEVTDSSPVLPRRREPGADAEHGRGLAIVAALPRSSGVHSSQPGKTSWLTLALTDRAQRAARQIDHEPEAGHKPAP